MSEYIISCWTLNVHQTEKHLNVKPQRPCLMIENAEFKVSYKPHIAPLSGNIRIELVSEESVGCDFQPHIDFSGCDIMFSEAVNLLAVTALENACVCQTVNGNTFVAEDKSLAAEIQAQCKCFIQPCGRDFILDMQPCAVP
ncbi:hypothetical protein SDC9_156680 [bioreactor metagenome]|uniref:Uncharacterized protein n=1 Tax=bioreactor metagenome TaxID=1076179 RepID=A0A645F687_9ZZZZ